jgi:exportin-2 (importin alpha re-exporter)
MFPVFLILSKSDRNILEQYFVPIMEIILTRLQSSKTENLTFRFVRFYHFFSARDEKGYSADLFIQITDQVQDG